VRLTHTPANGTNMSRTTGRVLTEQSASRDWRWKICQAFLLVLFLFFLIGGMARSVLGFVGLGIVCLIYEYLKRYQTPEK
jgi:1,4-dihydroxy-2-naphthoate octaprenyltransferase